MVDAPPGAGPFQALLRDIAMRTFDLAGERLALTLVLLGFVRRHDRDHAAIRLRDNLLVTTRCFREILRSQAGFGHALGVQGLGMAQSDPLDRALADRKAVMLKQFEPRLSERLIGGKVGDGALQRP